MIPLGQRTEACLRAAGWAPGRKWDGLTSARSSVQDEGHRTSEAAAAFLVEFGGLTLRHESQAGAETTTSLDPAKAAGDLDPLWLETYEEQAGTSLSVVGQAYRGHMTVLLADDGRVFLSFDHEFRWRELAATSSSGDVATGWRSVRIHVGGRSSPGALLAAT
jgi:hypothetical protein